MTTLAPRFTEYSSARVKMTSTKTAGTTKPRRAIALGGVAPECDRVVHTSCHHNNLVGVVERVILAKGTQPPQPQLGHFPRTLSAVYHWFERNTFVTRPWSEDELLEHTKPHKMRVTLNAMESLAISGISQLDAKIRGFVKAEKVFDKAAAPRVIQPRNPRYVVATSRFLKRLEGPIYKLLAKLWGGPTVMKGFNAEQVAQQLREMWDTFDEPVAVGLDASRFDQHVSEDALKWEHSIYKMFYRGWELKQLSKMLDWQVIQKAVFRSLDGVVRFTIRGGRASGDINTGMGNCLLMCSLVKAYADTRGVRCRLANNGDDCVIVMERRDHVKFSQGLDSWFTKMGFTMKVEAPVDQFESIVFCQTQPILVAGVWRMCRQFPACLRKDTTYIDVTLREAKGRIAAVGVCGLAVASGVPCLQSLYEKMAKVAKPTVGGVGYGFTMMGHGLEARTKPITDDTRLSFMAAFGVPPHIQRILEDKEISVDHSPVVFNCVLATSCHAR